MTEVLDVAIAGYGPVGQTLAALLGREGLNVGVFERHATPYGLPRAIRFDHEAMRVWQRLGIVAALEDDILAVDRYVWLGADGEPILTLPSPPAPSGWAYSYVFFQPLLEAALDAAVAAEAPVQVRRGVTVVRIEERDDLVELGLQDTDRPAAGLRTVRARYAVGADGGGSLVREALGIALEDLGFRERWVVIDVLPRDADALAPLDGPVQHCDPARPHVVVPCGRRHRRFEFMLLPGERVEDFAGVERAWALLAPYADPSRATIVRHAVYEFRSAVATSMQRGRCFLAGDAAHLMPPHMGEGMCSGVRDANGLAWKLALVVRGLAHPRVLESHTAERLPHNTAIVELSQAMGRISCELDPAAAAERDATLRAGGVAPPPFPTLHEGVTADCALAGTLAVQGVVEVDGRSGRLGEVAGEGFVLVSAQPEPWSALGDEARAFLDGLGTNLVALGDAPGAVRDVDGALTSWLERSEAAAVLIRPDSYVFGAARTNAELPALVDDLRRRLGPEHSDGGGT